MNKNALWRKLARRLLSIVLNERARRILTMGSIIGAVLDNDALKEIVTEDSHHVLEAISNMGICYNPKALRFPLMVNTYLINEDVKSRLVEFFEQTRDETDYAVLTSYLLDHLPVWLYYDERYLEEDLKLLSRYKKAVFIIA